LHIHRRGAHEGGGRSDDDDPVDTTGLLYVTSRPSDEARLGVLRTWLKFVPTAGSSRYQQGDREAIGYAEFNCPAKTVQMLQKTYRDANGGGRTIGPDPTPYFVPPGTLADFALFLVCYQVGLKPTR
jgi:hypothetical protein